MRSKQFSPLLRGSGPDWSSNFKWYGEQVPDSKMAGPPEQPPTQHSRYIIHERNLYRTVPKTYTTNKGAMLLYTSEDYVIKDKVSQAVHPPPAKDMDLIDLDNLQKNILQFGTNQVDSACMRFTRPSSDDVYLDERTRPGALPEVYLEDLKYKTRLFTKVNKMSTPRLRPTERIRSARSHAMSPPGCHVGSDSPDPQPPGTPASSRPPSGAQKRKLLRPPSAPPQPMPSVEKRKIEIIRDQLKHLDAAQRREKLKFADFELVSTIPDHLKVKGLEGKTPKRRAHSSPVYKTKFSSDTTYVTSEQTKSLPLFVVTSSPGHRAGPYSHDDTRPADTSLTRAEESHDSNKMEGLADLCSPLAEAAELEQQSAKLNIIAADITRRKRDSGSEQPPSSQAGKTKEGEEGSGHVVTANQSTEVTDQEIHDNDQTERCHSSRQIILDLQDKPKESFISDDLRQDVLEQTKSLGEGAVRETPSTTEQKGADEVSTSVEDSLQALNPTNRILTYPSFLSLSSANSKETQPQDDQSAALTHESENSVDEEAKREALQDAKTMVQEISHSRRSKKKRSGGKDQDGKKKTIKSAKPKKSAALAVSDQDPAVAVSVSDGEFKEKQPPKSLVAMHRDNIDSTSSITRKKSTSTGFKKKKGGKLSEKIAWDTHITRTDSDNDDVFNDKSPQTMLLDDDPDDQVTPSAPRQRKRLERPSKQRVDTSSVEQQTIPPPGNQQTEQNGQPESIGTLIKGDTSRIEGEEGEELDEDSLERIRQEEREKELKSLELLERRIGMEDGSLKRLGEKVEIIEKESIQQKDKETAMRQLEYQDELARKEEERKAYEEVMKAQEAEYERHLQNMLQQEEERNKLYLNQLRKEEVQRDIKRKLAMFRQNQNLELRQHVRLTKLKQKLTVPFKYSYFPILKVNYLKIVNIDAPSNKKGGKNGPGKTMQNKKMNLKRV